MQAKRRGATTDIRLLRPGFRKVCGSGATTRSAVQRKAKRRKAVTGVRGRGKGRFRTIGGHAIAASTGTDWSMTERCDGTLVRVFEGTVSVLDTNTRRTIALRAGRSYLATPRRGG